MRPLPGLSLLVLTATTAAAVPADPAGTATRSLRLTGDTPYGPEQRWAFLDS